MTYIRLPDTPTEDAIRATSYVRERAREIGVELLMTDSHLRNTLRLFLARRAECNVFYLDMQEAARSYWDQDAPYFKTFALIFRIIKERTTA